jgi:hypothetical protein
MENEKLKVYHALLKCHELNDDAGFDKIFSIAEIIEHSGIQGLDQGEVLDILNQLETEEVVSSYMGTMFWWVSDGGNYKG